MAPVLRSALAGLGVAALLLAGCTAPEDSSTEADSAAAASTVAPRQAVAPVDEIVMDEQRVARRGPPLERFSERELAEVGNPLAGREWGVYRGPMEQAWAPYTRSSGETRRLLGAIVDTPKANWFGAWMSNDSIAGRVTDYIANAQAGDPEALVQMTVFRIDPWYKTACKRAPSGAQQASYRDWIDRFAGAVGDTPTAIVLQPDLPFALCSPGGPAVPASLVAYASERLSALPNTSVYIEIGASDWPAPGQGGVDSVLRFLLPSGIEHARGVALNSTHYAATEDEIARGADVVDALAARGMPGKKVVIDTSKNGNPFKFGTYTGPDPDNAFVCTSPSDRRTCVTLGIPPTTDVGNPRWGLSESARTEALEHVDAYLWFGRPWLYRQNSPFVMERALGLVRSSPYF